MKHSLLKKKKKTDFGSLCSISRSPCTPPRPSPLHLYLPPPSHPSLRLTLSAALTQRTSSSSHHKQMAKKKKAACSVLRMTYLGGGTIRACVTARVHTCKPCLARGASSPWLKLSSFAPLMTPWHMLRKSEGLSTTERRASVCVCVSQN